MVVEAEGDDDRQEQHAEPSYHDDKLWAVLAPPIVDLSCPGSAIRLASVIKDGASRKDLRLAAGQFPPAIHRAVVFPLPSAFIDSALGRAADHAGQGLINFPCLPDDPCTIDRSRCAVPGVSGKQGRSALQQTGTSQHVAGDQEHEHSHAAVVHTHDHYHVTHHHTGGVLGEFEHRTRYHMHEHNHATLVHAHEGQSKEDERSDHESAAHTHDHDSPTGGIQNG